MNDDLEQLMRQLELRQPSDRLDSRISRTLDGTPKAGSSPGKIAWRWPVRIGLAAAAALVAAMLIFRPAPAKYPAPVATGDYRLVEGTAVGRGAVLATDDKAASVSLGGYCRIDVDPQSVIALAGKERAEEIVLRQGAVTCEVNSGVGGFVVRTELGTVSVKGTKFSVGLVDGADEWLKDSSTGGPMLGKRMIVRVLSGVVVAAGSWGSLPIGAGETQVLVDGAVAAPAPPGEAVKPDGGQAGPSGVTMGIVSSQRRGVHPELQYEYAQKKLGLTAEQTAKIKEIDASYDEKIKGMQKELQTLSYEQRKAKSKETMESFVKAREESKGKIEGVLQPQQVEQLKQLELDRSLKWIITAPSTPELEQVGLTAEQKEKLRVLREELSRKQEAIRMELTDQMVNVLTPEQKKKVPEIQAKRFEEMKKTGGGYKIAPGKPANPDKGL